VDGWFAIVPPLENLVQEMLKGTDLPPEEAVSVLDPMKGQATVAKIAANAVMAGCRPEYMPVLIAAVTGLGDPNFNLLGVSTTTKPRHPHDHSQRADRQAAADQFRDQCPGPGPGRPMPRSAELFT